MRIQSVCIIGGSGFVGRHVVQRLAASGIRVRVPTRKRERAKSLIVLPTVDVINANVHDPETLNRLFAGTDAVINLAGILHQTRKGEFGRVHIELPRRIVNACREEGVPRLIHMSALNAAHDAPSEYLRSKAGGEQQVRVAHASGIRTSIFRPSVIFGREDRFLNLFAKLARVLPVIALACPRARFQPIHVEDVAHAIVTSLENPRCFDQAYELGGPKVYTLQQLVEYACRLAGVDRPVLPLNEGLSLWLATFLEKLPTKLMTRDNLLSMKVDSVCSGPFPEVFGFAPAAMEAVVPLYFGEGNPRARYRAFRVRARR
jgi:uncharacterized protein YbjT (DUF2867 family)